MTNKPKKSFEYYVAFAWILLMLLGSVLGTIAFIRTQISLSKKSSIDSYSEVFSSSDISLFDSSVQEFTFQNSSLFIPTTKFSSNGSGDFVQSVYSSVSNFCFSVKKVGGTFSVAALVAPVSSVSNQSFSNISFFNAANVVSYPNIGSSNNLKILASNPLVESGEATFFFDDIPFTSTFFDLPAIGNIIDYSSFTSTTVLDSLSLTGFTDSNYSFFIGFQADYDVSLDFLGVHIYNTWFGVRGYGYNCKVNVLDYFDSNGKIFRIMLPFCYIEPQDFFKYAFQDRTYYFNLNPDADGYYWSGYNDGKSDGIQEGYDDGFKDGKDVGFIDGKGVGYNEGLKMGSNASFYDLLGALVDVPVQSMFNVLNFDLLGFNMADFLFALFTVCIVITIARLVLARG